MIISNVIILYVKHIAYTDDFPLNGYPVSRPTYTFVPFRRSGIFVLSVDAPVDSAV